MEYDKEKVDDMMLALLSLSMFEERFGTRAWKGFNWEHMKRLHEKGYISNPKSKAKSVFVTDEGRKRADELFQKYFSKEIDAKS
ncbi:MAG: DUF6429 family protein [Balneolales bacterium]|nr:DUF6429 family protein [Balneolales bacterium]